MISYKYISKLKIKGNSKLSKLTKSWQIKKKQKTKKSLINKTAL